VAPLSRSLFVVCPRPNAECAPLELEILRPWLKQMYNL
jgi:hypothetical protein